jgi:hypothetical protein
LDDRLRAASQAGT